MYSSVRLSFLLAISITFVAAQDPTPVAPPSNGGCSSQQLVDQCVMTMKSALAKCTTNDWDCKCTAQANIANCYVDCLNNADSFSAQLASAETCATANAYDAGLTAVPATWTTPGPSTATPAEIDSVDDDDDNKAKTTSAPTKPLKEQKDTKPSEGAAAAKAAGSWLALLGLGIGIAF
ncbi:hypothetical protein N7532_005177 [Penicillium argentinense]|uniref:Extracellular membrane protein CFEM domain-containing protein n=1 Tax=Penicillium argentinense TaxID=1131581 RepID=A0A9W9KA41_9EURO|nr:uncharacterized protein N7532_005177 [Penicillium argentinense]KAJ5098176.1 hypothetical protein N7532_005177 [Penicillium argentinense]